MQHKVGKIHTLTSKESWHHIPGKLNPADWATRGLYPKQLFENSECVAGPKWLHDFHPSSNSFIPFSEQPVPLVPIDQSKSLSDYVVLSTGVDYSLSFLDKYSSDMKVVRTVAWIFRFYHNSKSVSKVTGPLYTHELGTSIKKVAKLLQNGEYHTELNLLKCDKPLPKSSRLQSLNVFHGSEGILRVGGRLRLQQTLKFEQKHPMLIPKNHHFTSLIIRHFHRVNFHAGQELVYPSFVSSFGYLMVVSSNEGEKDVLVSLAALLTHHLAAPNQMDAGRERPNGRMDPSSSSRI
ncbi:integrase catalytic domain-containing protein [Trichonephila clavipes]|nr:integrase catalytic domain-containing protein [Trichonephila clavipes]